MRLYEVQPMCEDKVKSLYRRINKQEDKIGFLKDKAKSLEAQVSHLKHLLALKGKGVESL